MSRNASVDIAKIIAAIFVIGVHTRPFRMAPEMLDFIFDKIIFRFAVPFFAICTGYFMTKKLLKDGMSSWMPVKSMAFKTAGLYVVWSLFYLIVSVFEWYKSGSLTVSSFTGWLFSFAVGTSYYHLWYLSQLFLALLLFYPIVKKLDDRWILTIAIILWSIGVFVFVYSDCIPFMYRFVREHYVFGAFYGTLGRIRILPLLLIGSLLAKRPAIEQKKAGLFALISLVCLFGEVFILKEMGAIRFKYEFFSLPFADFFFSLVVNSKISCPFDTRDLSKSSLYVYVLHPAVILLLQQFIVTSDYMCFILVSIISLFLSIGIVWMKRRKILVN